jgi:hypothetical protein
VLHDDEVLEGQGSLTFYLDGAHTEESMVECARWWAESVTLSESSGAQYSLNVQSLFSECSLNVRGAVLPP